MGRVIKPLMMALTLLALVAGYGCVPQDLGGQAEKSSEQARPAPAAPAPASVKAEPAGPEPVVHVVKYPGETLAKISRWYTGTQNNWKRIMEHNQIKSVVTIQLGQEIIIPGDLVERRDPMPRPEPRAKAEEQPSGAQGAAAPTSVGEALTGSEADQPLGQSAQEGTVAGPAAAAGEAPASSMAPASTQAAETPATAPSSEAPAAAPGAARPGADGLILQPTGPK